jgi:hypothetical protein
MKTPHRLLLAFGHELWRTVKITNSFETLV